MSVILGDEVKDSVSGFKGIAVGRHEYLQGCARITVQPKAIDKNGTLPDERSFDEPQLIVTKCKVVKQGNRKVGGPAKHKDTKKSATTRR